jgi:hypothetical protein
MQVNWGAVEQNLNSLVGPAERNFVGFHRHRGPETVRRNGA